MAVWHKRKDKRKWELERLSEISRVLKERRLYKSIIGTKFYEVMMRRCYTNVPLALTKTF